MLLSLTLVLGLAGQVAPPQLSEALGAIAAPSHIDEAKRLVQQARAAARDDKERALVDRAEVLLVRLTSQSPADDAALAALYREVTALLRDAATRYPDDVQMQLTLHGTLLWSLSVAELKSDHASIRAELLRRCEALRKRHPSDARTHHGLALALHVLGRTEDAMRAWAACLKLPSGTEVCRSAYREAVEAWRVPQCAKDDVAPDLALYAEDPTGATAFRLDDAPGAGAPEIRVKHPPLARTADVVSVTQLPSSGVSALPSCSLLLGPSAAARVAEATRALAVARIDTVTGAVHRGRAALVSSTRVLFAAEVMEEIKDGRILVAAQGCASMCRRLSTPPLPPGLPEP